MNRKQRNRNRDTARQLAAAARARILMSHICENCGDPGGHWISTRGTSLAGLISGVDDQEGFWTCQKLYGSDGRRSPEHDASVSPLGFGAAIFAMARLAL